MLLTCCLTSSLTKDNAKIVFYIRSANKGDNLTHFDPTALSMVALNQLPLLNINTEGGCIIPDKILINSVQATSEEIIRYIFIFISSVFDCCSSQTFTKWNSWQIMMTQQPV